MSIYLLDDIVVAADFRSELSNLTGTPLTESEVLALGLPNGFPYMRVNPNDLTDVVRVKSIREVRTAQELMEEDDTYENVVHIFKEEVSAFKAKEKDFSEEKIHEKPETNEKVEEFFEKYFGPLAKFRHEYAFELASREDFDTIAEAYLSFSHDEINMMKSVRLSNIISLFRKTNEANYILNKNRLATLFYTEVYERAVAPHRYITDVDKLVDVCRDYVAQNFPHFYVYAENDFRRFFEIFPDFLKYEEEIRNCFFSDLVTVYMKKLDDLSYNDHFFNSKYPVYFIQFMNENNETSFLTRDGNIPVVERIRILMRMNGFIEISSDVYGFQGNENDAQKIMENLFGKVAYGTMNERKREERENRPENVTKEEFVKFMQDVRKKKIKNTEEGKNENKDKV